jgi:gamma-glutamyltranspeptidase/glutathione hydrolase
MLAPAVAAGHPATAAAGAEILASGGSAADAAVAACLASCVAETVMTGILGGGFAIYYDAASRVARNLDFFVGVPSGTGEPMQELEVPFGEELVHYAIGASSAGVPGLPAGLDALWREHGRLNWPDLAAPALRLARDGVEFPEAHARCLEMLEPVMTLREGAAIFRPNGELLHEGGTLRQPELQVPLERLRDEGAAALYTGSLADELLELVGERGGRITRHDLASYRPVWFEPVEVPFAGTRLLTRSGLSGVPETLGRLRRYASEPERALALLDALAEPTPDGHTTNFCVADERGDICVVTTSLGLGSGDFLHQMHLNSMLGEADLVRGELVPGTRMGSMMAPSIALDDDGPALAIGAAGGTRLRTALVGVTAGILCEGLEPQEAIERPRFHPAGRIVNAEPGVDDSALAALESRGLEIHRWPKRHHYFGGVSALGRRGAGADPRRSGGVRVPGA